MLWAKEEVILHRGKSFKSASSNRPCGYFRLWLLSETRNVLISTCGREGGVVGHALAALFTRDGLPEKAAHCAPTSALVKNQNYDADGIVVVLDWSCLSSLLDLMLRPVMAKTMTSDTVL